MSLRCVTIMFVILLRHYPIDIRSGILRSIPLDDPVDTEYAQRLGRLLYEDGNVLALALMVGDLR